jgi:hypothetical protein
VLCLGPPHSGKSVFCYVLFKILLELENDSVIMDADYYSPTLRRLRIDEFTNLAERARLILTPFLDKQTSITEESFSVVVRELHSWINRKGVIVVDGIGKHSKSTEALLDLADNLILVCPDGFDVDAKAKEVGYVEDSVCKHPFDFYDKWKKKTIKIVSHCDCHELANLDEKNLTANLFGLRREAIQNASIEEIPQKTRDVIKQIAILLVKELSL